MLALRDIRPESIQIGSRPPAVLAAFLHLEAVPSDARAWPKSVRGAERLAARLNASRDEVMRYRTLTRLRKDVPLAESLDDLRVRS